MGAGGVHSISPFSVCTPGFAPLGAKLRFAPLSKSNCTPRGACTHSLTTLRLVAGADFVQGQLGLTKMRYRCCYDIFIIYYDISAAAARWPRAPTATRLLLVALQGLFTRVLIIVEIPRNPGPGFSSRRSRNSILVSHTKCVNFGIFPHSEL